MNDPAAGSSHSDWVKSRNRSPCFPTCSTLGGACQTAAQNPCSLTLQPPRPRYSARLCTAGRARHSGRRFPSPGQRIGLKPPPEPRYKELLVIREKEIVLIISAQPFMNAAMHPKGKAGCAAKVARLAGFLWRGCYGRQTLPALWFREVAAAGGPAAGLLLTACMLVDLPCAGTTFPQYSSRIWQAESGLPHDSVNCICQTKDGYLWIGTERGLARFDGVTFDALAPPEVPALKNAAIGALSQTRDGSLWIGTAHHGLVCFKGGKFSVYRQAQGLVGDSVQGLTETSDGALWIGTTDGLSCWRNGRFTNFTRADGLGENSVRAISEDRQGNIWVVSSVGLYRLRDGGFVRDTHRIGGGLRMIWFEEDGALWLGASRVGAARFAEGQRKLFCATNGLPDDLLTTLYRDREGRMWVGTMGGLSCISAGDEVNEIQSEGVGFPPVNTVFEDREGNLWVGTLGGLYRLNPRVFASYTKANGLVHNLVMSLLEDRAGRMWITTWGGGVGLLQDGQFTPLTALNRMSNNRALSLCESSLGSMWVGMDFKGGLFCVKENGIERYDPPRGLTDPAVTVVCEDEQQNVWLGTPTALLRLRDGIFTRYTRAEGLAGDNVHAILSDRQGGLWVGTTEGLSHFVDGRFRNFGLREGLSHTNVTALYADATGALWIGTDGGGLNQLQDGRIRHWNRSDGLFSDELCEILEDRLGFLWMSSLHGVFRVARKNLEAVAAGSLKTVPCTVYGRFEGMPSPLTGHSKPSAWRTRDGRLWFATRTGLAVADPSSSPQPSAVPPPVRIERLVVDRKDVSLHEPVRVPPNRGDLEIHYAALSFRRPERNRYKYKLEGVESEWVEAGARKVAYYNRILPGSYHFQVIGCDADGVWNEDGADLAFVILPHSWQTWWFRMALVAFGALALGGVYLVRLAQRRQLEKLRSRIAADLHDELSSNIGGISLLSRLMQQSATSKEQAQDLGLIHRIAAQTADSIKDIVWFTNPGNDTAQDLLSRLQDVANTLLAGAECDFSGEIQHPSARIPLDFRRNLFLIFKETIANIVKHANATRVTITLTEAAGLWRLRVQDNGAGFDPNSAKQGNGLKNLRRRALNINGALKIETAPGKGTAVTLEASVSGRTRLPAQGSHPGKGAARGTITS